MDDHNKQDVTNEVINGHIIAVGSVPSITETSGDTNTDEHKDNCGKRNPVWGIWAVSIAGVALIWNVALLFQGEPKYHVPAIVIALIVLFYVSSLHFQDKKRVREAEEASEVNPSELRRSEMPLVGEVRDHRS